MKMIVKTFQGLEAVLAKELEGIGAKNIRELRRAVACEGDQRVLLEFQGGAVASGASQSIAGKRVGGALCSGSQGKPGASLHP